jgi:glycosyltransferase involved in cell wall biosynthesis
MIQFSIIIPVFNGAKTIESIILSIEKELVGYSFETILINDGSKDDSKNICLGLSKKHKNLRFIDLRKNFGEFNAVICGMQFIKGQYAVIIDDDFQNPPSEIIKLYQKALSENLDVVYSYYESKKHNWFRNVGSNLVNYFTTYLLRKPKDLYLSSFKIIKKEVIEEIIKFKGPNPYIDALIFQITDSVGKQLVMHKERANGESNYSVRKLLSLFFTILFGYSMLPLRLTFLAGFSSIIFSLIYMLLYIFNIINDWGSPIVIFMCGFILCAISLVGEYIGNTLMVINGKPQYIIKSNNSKEENLE